ncbi:hypothetical protein L1279_001142 [Planomicrobium sp. HSC-17F08]|nr:hypothetical protein [Planomicrobium sp. HSC-17F08]
MNKEAVREINSMDKQVAFAATEEMLKDMESRLKTRFPAFARAASNIEEIEVMDFTVEYGGPKKGYVLTDWVFGLRPKFG